MGIQGFRHPDHDNKPMGADDWSSELGDFGGSVGRHRIEMITDF